MNDDEIIEYELRYCQDVILQEICLDMTYENIKHIVNDLTDGYLRSRLMRFFSFSMF